MVYGINSRLIEGDALNPSSTDLIVQTGQLAVGKRLPDGWRVLTGNMHTSRVARVVYRFEATEGF